MRAIPIPVQHLFGPLDEKLISLLSALSEEDWERPTSAKKWRVKDVAAHLLDGNLRALSIQRDGYFGENPPSGSCYKALVGWLNQLNADWVRAAQRLSPAVLVMLHRATGPATTAYYESLDPWAKAIFAVDWVGEDQSLNWMHLAREYTEKWHHQQQIRDAVGQEGIMTREFFFPLIDTFFRAWPHAFREVEAPEGTLVKATISGELGGAWWLERKAGEWGWAMPSDASPHAEVILPPGIAWKLFCKNIRPQEVAGQLTYIGDAELGKKVLDMVAVMA